ncbi:MAG: hypothetical protein WB870_08235 [Gallionellaceae bacterium]
MDHLWGKQLPGKYRNFVVRPIAFEYHTEPSANAERIIGFDSRGAKCFDCHSFVLTEEGFDADEFPILTDVYYERVVAWRLRKGHWIRIKSFVDSLDHCNKHLTTLPVELTETA